MIPNIAWKILLTVGLGMIALGIVLALLPPSNCGSLLVSVDRPIVAPGEVDWSGLCSRTTYQLPVIFLIAGGAVLSIISLLIRGKAMESDA